jgi:beta-galactosidase/beta-glucuronidase
MTMPCRWSEGGLRDFAGRVRFRRHFGYPGRIDENERVWLTFAGVEGTAEIRLNGEFLGRRDSAQQSFEFDITRLLRDRNELRVELEGPETGGLTGEVALEIRLEESANSF